MATNKQEQLKQDDLIYGKYSKEDETMREQLKAHEEENIRRAQEKEEALLNRPSPILDAIMNGIDKLEKLIKGKNKNKNKNKSKIIEQKNNSGNER